MLGKVLSDGAINEVGIRGYAGRDTVTESPSQNFYHQLERGPSAEDVFTEEDESANYVDLID